MKKKIKVLFGIIIITLLFVLGYLSLMLLNNKEETVLLENILVNDIDSTEIVIEEEISDVVEAEREEPEVVEEICVKKEYFNEAYPDFTFEYNSCDWIVSEYNQDGKFFYNDFFLHPDKETLGKLPEDKVIRLISVKNHDNLQILISHTNYMDGGGMSPCYRGDYAYWGDIGRYLDKGMVHNYVGYIRPFDINDESNKEYSIELDKIINIYEKDEVDYCRAPFDHVGIIQSTTFPEINENTIFGIVYISYNGVYELEIADEVVKSVVF